MNNACECFSFEKFEEQRISKLKEKIENLIKQIKEEKSLDNLTKYIKMLNKYYAKLHDCKTYHLFEPIKFVPIKVDNLSAGIKNHMRSLNDSDNLSCEEFVARVNRLNKLLIYRFHKE